MEPEITNEPTRLYIMSLRLDSDAKQTSHLYIVRDRNKEGYMRRDSGRGKDDEMCNVKRRRKIRIGHMWRGGK